MKRALLLLLILCVMITGGLFDTALCGQRIGGGIHYLRTLGDITDTPEFDENAVGIMASYQYSLKLLKIEADLEWIADYGGSDKSMIQPQAWVLIGSSIYGSVGTGIGYIDGDWQDNPFYAIRAGLDLNLVVLNLDLFVSYRFQSSQALKHIQSRDLDAITFGVVGRIGY